MSLPRRAAAHAPLRMNVTTPVPVRGKLNAAREPAYWSVSDTYCSLSAVIAPRSAMCPAAWRRFQYA